MDLKALEAELEFYKAYSSKLKTIYDIVVSCLPKEAKKEVLLKLFLAGIHKGEDLVGAVI